MTQDTDLFLSLAEIAGVFVGFGALISVTRRDSIDSTHLLLTRTVVVIGLVVMVAALVPVSLGRYGLSGHTLWFWSSSTFFVLIWVAILISTRRPDSRAQFSEQARSSPIATAFFWLCLEIPIQVPLVLALLGWYPTLEPAFYTTALVLNLFEAAFVLTQLVLSQVVAPNR